MRAENDAFDKAFDIMITEAAVKADENIGKKLTENEEEIVFSAEHEEKMRKIFQRERRRRLAANAAKYSKRCACVLAVLVSAASISILSVDAWRERAMNFIFDPSKPNTDFSFSTGSYHDDAIDVGYIPDGFNVTYCDHMDGVSLSFENGTLYFSLDVKDVDGTVGIDTEDAVIEELTIQGHRAIYSSNKRVNILLWNDDDYVYTICGNIDKNEIIQTAESIRY